MGPLSIPTTTQTTPTPLILAGHSANSRDKVDSESRPISLPSDQILPISEEISSQVARKPTESESIHSAENERGDHPTRKSNNSALQLLTLDPSFHAVTYQIHPDLQGILQGNVIDHATKEILRQIPSDERIQLMTTYRQDLGSTLDKLA